MGKNGYTEEKKEDITLILHWIITSEFLLMMLKWDGRQSGSCLGSDGVD